MDKNLWGFLFYFYFFVCLCFYFSLLSSVITCKFEHAALDSDDLLYLKEQMEAEEDAERLLRRTEKRAFAAFKISFIVSAMNWNCLFVVVVVVV